MVIRPLPCIHLGEIQTRTRCNCPRKYVRKCALGLGKDGLVRQFKDCEVCDRYEADMESDEAEQLEVAVTE